MKKYLSSKTAYLIFIATSAIGLLYNLAVLLRFVDYHYAWGGRLTTIESMYSFVTFSIISNLAFLTIVTVAKKQIDRNNLNSKLRILILLMAILFLVNTLGNIFAITLFEKIVFTPMTLLASLSLFRLSSKN